MRFKNINVIYLIHNVTQNIYYIGKTNNWRRRAKEHGLKIPSYRKNRTRYFTKVKPLFKGNPYIHEAIEAGDEIEYTWIEICDDHEVNTAEEYWIQMFKQHGYKLYNRTCGGHYDDQPLLKEIDISNYDKRKMLDVNAVSRYLQNNKLMSNDYVCHGLEEKIRNTLITQTPY